MNFRAEYTEVNGLQATLGNIVQADEKPEGNWRGSFRRYACAEYCANLGMTEQQAHAASHGSSDEVFCATLLAL